MQQANDKFKAMHFTEMAILCTMSTDYTDTHDWEKVAKFNKRAHFKHYPGNRKELRNRKLLR
jgi:hypothetical protein